MSTVSSPRGAGIAGAPGVPDAPAQHAAPLWRELLRGGVPRRGLRGAVLLGLFGSVLIMVGGVGAGAVLQTDPLLSDSPLTWIRFGHGRHLATIVLYIGIALMVLAWVRLGRAARDGSASTRDLGAAALVWAVPMLFTASLFSMDIYSYLAQGNLDRHGLDPYAVGPSALPGPLTANVSWVWQNTPAPYGPLFMLLAKIVVGLTGESPLGGMILLRVVMAAGLVLLCWALPRLARYLGGRPTIAVWLGAANPLVLIQLVGGGHNDLLMIGLLLVGVVLLVEDRPLWGIAVVTLAVAVKATAALALPFLVWIWAAKLAGRTGNRRAAIGTALGAGLAVFVAVFAACSVVAGLGLGWLPALAGSSAIVNWMSLPTGVGEFLHTVFGSIWVLPVEPFLVIARSLGWLVLAGVLVRQWWAARDGGPDAVRRAGIALLAVAVLSPAAFPWYLTWPLVVCAGLAFSTAALQVLCWGSVMLVLVTYPSGDTALYSWWFLLGSAVVCALAAWSLVRVDPLGLGRDAPGRPLPARLPATVLATSQPHRPDTGPAEPGQAGTQLAGTQKARA